MTSNHHDLAHEFPEFKDSIHNLKLSNNHFRNLAEKFELTDKAISRSEQRVDLLSAEQEEKLRKERLQLKDEIYKILSSHK